MSFIIRVRCDQCGRESETLPGRAAGEVTVLGAALEASRNARAAGWNCPDYYRTHHVCAGCDRQIGLQRAADE